MNFPWFHGLFICRIVLFISDCLNSYDLNFVNITILYVGISMMLRTRKIRDFKLVTSETATVFSIHLPSYVFVIIRYQQMLHRNLVYLATIADSNQNAQNAASVRSLD